METVLGVSMAPTAVRMVLVEGETADGAIVDTESFEVAGAQVPATSSPNQVVSAILGTREGAAESGYHLTSTGVAWTDPVDAAALRDLLAGHKVENVMLVSAFLAAAALAQAVGNSSGYTHTGLLYIEPDTATLAVVDSADGSVVDVHRHPLPEDDADAVAELAAMVSSAESLETRPDGLFVVGSEGVDIAPIKPALEQATSLALSAPEEPETALARGAALASANAPLFASSTAAMAYAQDPGTGVVDPYALAGYVDVPGDGAAGGEGLAYSADPEEAGAVTVLAGGPDAYTAAAEEDFGTGAYPEFGAEPLDAEQSRKPFLVAMGVLTIFVIGVAALAIALALAIRPHVDQRPSLAHPQVVQPPQPAPPPQAPPAPAPAPAAPAPAAPAPAAPAPPGPPPPPALPAPPPVLPVPAPPIPVGPPPVPVPAPPIPVGPPPIPGPGIPGPPGIPAPGIPGPGIPGPPLPGPGIPHIPLPGIPHL